MAYWQLREQNPALSFPLAEANQVLLLPKHDQINGAAVLKINARG